MLPMQGAWGSIPGQGSRSHMLHLRPNTVKEINKNKYFLKKNLTCNEGDAGSTPGWETKIPHARG